MALSGTGRVGFSGGGTDNAEWGVLRVGLRGGGFCSTLMNPVGGAARMGLRAAGTERVRVTEAASGVRVGLRGAGADAVRLSASPPAVRLGLSASGLALLTPPISGQTFGGDISPAMRRARLAFQYLEGSSVIQPVPLQSFLDLQAAAVLTGDLQRISDTLAGATARVLASGEEDFVKALGPLCDRQAASAQPDIWFAAQFGPTFTALNSYLAKNSGGATVNLNAYATQQNAVTRNSFLVAPPVAYLQWLIYGSSQPTLLMSPGNVFAPVTTLAACMVGAGGAVSFGAQSSIRTVNDTTLGLQGYTPAPGAVARVLSPITGTLTVTFTAAGQDSTGNAVTGRTWTAVLDNAPAGARIPLVPSVGGDRLASLSAATGAGTADAGTWTVETTPERILQSSTTP